MPNYDLLHEDLRDSVRLYVEFGVKPGSFLTAVICNDLKESFARADENNIRRMFDIVSFFYNEVPLSCWGSKENMETWMQQRRNQKQS